MTVLTHIKKSELIFFQGEYNTQSKFFLHYVKNYDIIGNVAHQRCFGVLLYLAVIAIERLITYANIIKLVLRIW